MLNMLGKMLANVLYCLMLIDGSWIPWAVIQQSWSSISGLSNFSYADYHNDLFYIIFAALYS